MHWLNFVSGIDLSYSLGDDFSLFLSSPEIGSVPTGLATVLLAVIFVCIATVLVRFFVRLWKNPATVKDFLRVSRTNTSLALAAAFFGYGVQFILLSQPFFLYYVIVAFSLPALSIVWLDRAASRGGIAANSRRLLTVLTITQALVTMLFLSYIHGSAYILGDYGTPYRMQIQQSASQPVQ